MKSLKLTTNEWNVVTTILDQVNEHLTWNNENNWYEDTGDIIFTFDPEEKKALTRVVKKLFATAIRSDKRLHESIVTTEKERVKALQDQIRELFQCEDNMGEKKYEEYPWVEGEVDARTHEVIKMSKAKKIKFFYNENDFGTVWDENGKKYPIYRGETSADADVFVNPDDVDVSHCNSIKHLKEKIK